MNAARFASSADACRRPRTGAPRVLVAALAVAFVAGAADGESNAAPVTVRTEVDGSGHNYKWTIENRHTLPITRLSFPHYHVDQFIPPRGWNTDGTTNLAMAGNPDAPGVCVAAARSSRDGILPGRRGVVSARVAKSGANRRRGAITVGFSDGSEMTITEGVLLPTAPSLGERLAVPAGLALVFAILVLASLRRRGASTAAAEPAPPTDD